MLKRIIIFLLKFVSPNKPFGTELFNAIAKISVTVSIEALAVRTNSLTNKKEIFLTQRAKDEKSYPGAWHAPGTVVRAGEDFDQAIGRLAKNEFGVPISEFFCVGIFNNLSEPRGHFFSPVFQVKLEGEPKKGKWFALDALPENTADNHSDYLFPAFAELNNKVLVITKKV